MLKKTQSSADADASRILGKGPEFLRRQLERESDASKGRVSAVERLAASKPQYVKSQQVAGATPEPVISVGSASVSSQGSSNERDSVKKATGFDAEEKQTRQEEHNVVRRISSKKRPDSVLLYRQKCELLKGSPGGGRRVIKRALFSRKDKTTAFLEAQGDGSDSGVNERKDATRTDSEKVSRQVTNGSTHSDPQPCETHDVRRAPLHRSVADAQQQERTSRRGVARSSSDISSRYSKNFADFDAFFLYCGLEGDVIASLGKENFCARSDDVKIRSVSVSTSDDGSSRSSGRSDGLQLDELQETGRQGCSVVERNARIIKWLYSCRNAAESGKTLRDLD